jgi:ABC-type sugar transport system ATPase subunit
MSVNAAVPVPQGQAGTGAAAPEREAFLEVRKLVKQFPGTLALDGVDLTIRSGEIHALLGENCAGKSTLIRIVCGASQPTEGRILVRGVEVSLSSPHDASALGIAVVHQHFNLVPQISVAENLFLSQSMPRRAGLLVDWRMIERQAAKLLDRVGLDLDPRRDVSALRPDEAAMVAIAKAIGSEAGLIILDEPTTALLPNEVAILFGHMRRLARDGHSFLYVSHRLSEVFEIADHVTVLRDGRDAGDWSRADMNRRAIIGAIVGGRRQFSDEAAEADVAFGDPVLMAENLCGGRVADLSFKVRAREILGFAGLPGSGAEEAFDLLYGRYRTSGGKLFLKGVETAFRSPRDAKAAGIALVPKDRHAESLLPGASVRENIALPNLKQYLAEPILRFIHRGRERNAVEEVAQRLSVRMTSIESPISSLSGGNQQKAVLGRWLASGAKTFLLNSPTAAVDIGAKAEIYELIRQIAAGGAAIIFTSTEVEEFPRVCHRVLVFRQGRVVGELFGKEATESNILNLAAGGADER